MNPQQLLAHFDRFAEAPNAIWRLRRFILDLAVRGKLVGQDPGDEPACELLERIRENESHLSENGKSKKTASLPPIDPIGMPFFAPKGWQWARFIEVASIQSNLVDPKDHRDSPHIAPDNIESGTGRLLPYETIGNSAVFSPKHYFFAGSILYSKIRPALAKAAIVDFDGLCSADMYPILAFISRDYLHKYILSDVFVEQSVSEDTRVAMPKINQAALSKIVVAVPPLAEQRRIVAKVDELMGLCDRLEAAQGERERRRDRLAAASLHRLNHPADAGHAPAFREHARFHLQHLPRLTTRPDQIPALRQTILNLAVRGRLVPQDPNDGTPQEIKQKADEITEDEIPFDVPLTWKWRRLGSIAELKLRREERATVRYSRASPCRAKPHRSQSGRVDGGVRRPGSAARHQPNRKPPPPRSRPPRSPGARTLIAAAKSHPRSSLACIPVFSKLMTANAYN